jgi:hypothetical protein
MHHASIHEALVAAGATYVHDEYLMPRLDPFALLFLELQMGAVTESSIAVQARQGKNTFTYSAPGIDDTYIPPVLRPRAG